MGRRFTCLVACVTYAASLAGVLSCGGAKGDPVPDVAGVTVNPTTVTIVGVGNTATLTATVLGKLGPVDNPNVTWSADSPNIVGVPSSGATVTVTAKAAGTSVVRATSGGQTGTASVTVAVIAVASLSIADHVVSLAFGGTKTLTAQAYDAGGLPLLNRTIAWVSRSASIATVSSSGLVTAVGSGSTWIVATCEGKADSASVTVGPAPVGSVTISPSSSNIIVGKTGQLDAVTKDAAGNVLTGRTITWTSSDNAIATVSTTGLVTAVAVGGPVTITAASEGKTGTATVTVLQVPIASIAITPSSTTMFVGQTTQLTAVAKDSSGNPLSGRVLTWGSSDSSVATVSSTGAVTAVKAGNATISAIAEGVIGTSAVTVQVGLPPVTVTLTGTGTGSGKITSSPGGLNCTQTAGVASGTCSIGVAVGTVVSLTATPSAGFVFGSWTGACAGSGSCQLTVNSNVTVGFSFVASQSTLTLVNAGTGGGNIALSPASIPGCITIIFRASCVFYPTGTTVTLTATPSAGSLFTSWSGGCASSGTNPICQLVLSQSTSVTATWTLQPPSATTGIATSITSTTATLNGCVAGVTIATQVWFEWGPTTSLGSASAKSDQAVDNVAYCWTLPLSGLPRGTTQFFRILASNANGTSTGSTVSFVTLP